MRLPRARGRAARCGGRLLPPLGVSVLLGFYFGWMFGPGTPSALAVEMEGPLTGTGVLPGTGPAGTSDDGDYHLTQVRFENDGTWLRMVVPLRAPWSHWTLTKPARIVVDLGHTISCLPDAPGLFQARINRGSVSLFRTSQFRYSSNDHRVRLTLELSKMVPYQARRVGDEIQILIPDPEPRSPRELVLGPHGMSVQSGEGSNASPLPLAPSGGPPPQSAAILGGLMDAVKRGAKAGGDGPASPAPGNSGRKTPPRTLREALESTVPYQQLVPLSGSAPDEALESAPAAPPGVRPSRQTPARTPVSAPVPGKDPEKALSVWIDALDDSLPTFLQVRERSAARLLRASCTVFLAGDLAKASESARRAHHFYPGTPSGGQAGLLLRELCLLEEKRQEADTIRGLPAAPDSARLPTPVFLRLIDHYEAKSDLTELDRLLRAWAPHYDLAHRVAHLHLALGEAFYWAKRPDLAREHLVQVPPGDSLEARTLLILATIDDEAGNKAKALELYRRISQLPSGPFQMRGLARSADLEFQTGLVGEALRTYESLLAGPAPRDEIPWAVYQTANCHLLLGEPGKARSSYEALVKQWPQSFWTPFAQERLEELSWREQLSKGPDGKSQ